MTMSSRTKRENDNIGDVNLCTACARTDGLPCSPCSGFLDLESKIAQTEILLQNLIAQQNEFRTKISKSHDPITHRLPLELTTHIFELSLPPSWSTSTLPEPSEAELYTILYISAVCRTWRQIAMGTPRLWKTIPISLGNNYERHEITLKYVKEWLQRAGNYPLSLRIYADSKFEYMPRSQSGWGRSWGWDWDNDEEDDDALLSLVSLINRQSYRWQNLQLAVPPDLLWVLKGDILGAPIIEKLSIRGVPSNSTVWDGSHDMFSLMGPIKPAPSAVYAPGVGRIDIDWHNVTTVELGKASFNECLVLLRQAVGLIHCALEPVVIGDATLAEESSVICPSVQFLRIRGSNSYIMDMFWDLLTLPQLCTLDVTPRSSNLPYHQIMDMLDRSSCRLTSLLLKYSHCELGDAQPFELFRRTPHLTELSLVKTDDGYWGSESGFYHDVNIFCQFLNGQARASAPGNSTSVEAFQDGVKQLVLPNLKFLAMHNIPIYDGPEVQWSGVADLFDDPTTSHNSLPISLHRRPLTTFRISFAPDYIQDTPPSPYIDTESLQRFSNIMESGNVSLEFLVPDPNHPGGVVDLIACSITRSGMSEVPDDRYYPEDERSNYS